MKLSEALEILKETGYNINLTESQFTDRVMQDAMEDDQFIGADELESQEAAQNDANAFNEYHAKAQAIIDQYDALRKQSMELAEDPMFKDLDPNDAAYICHIATSNDQYCDDMFQDYYEGED